MASSTRSVNFSDICPEMRPASFSLKFSPVFRAMIFARLVAPLAVFTRFTGETPRELSEKEIKEIISFFAVAAGRAQEAGFDGIEISGSAGYLISQFLSPVTNKRIDKYGGDLQGRMTFPLEVIEEIRRVVGPDFPIIVRVAGNDFIPGGNSSVEAQQFCAALERAGVDAISVTGGWHETNVPQITMDVPAGAFSYLGQAVKSIVNIPVIVCNRINIKLAEKLVDEGQADFVGIARGFVAEPALVAKGAKGEYASIKPCIGCNQGCMDNIFFGKELSCLVNPEAGREYELMTGGLLVNQTKTVHPENILVIGAGPAGLEYARVAAGRGHQVTIWEEKQRAGGQALIASAPPGRQDFMRFIDYLENACMDVGVKIVYGKKAYADAVLAAVNSGEYDRVVIAKPRKTAANPWCMLACGFSIPVVSRVLGFLYRSLA